MNRQDPTRTSGTKINTAKLWSGQYDYHGLYPFFRRRSCHPGNLPGVDLVAIGVHSGHGAHGRNRSKMTHLTLWSAELLLCKTTPEPHFTSRKSLV
jgi:hypothetical protein